ncbi:hypothetical protein ATE47_16590 [Chryseobacterium sp. IHB B 17019]|jgi:hypothetical protein|uniref:DUF4382 domain-containing protein n=1 Tax=Chryseobacterium sp. IHB B 17019 TaxID=1721091 RepID=UPI000721B1EB|nr:DUF4382 domain-containing protein [Chryseobacterium sp. IHB B 17019]ALR32037.1 hypothetical protein ATE47_16590 [Chryseobacterium sp. IHB B 17019]
MKNFILLGSCICVLFFASCNDSDESGTATVNVRLTDGPADYDAVNIDIRGIEINSNGQWVALNFPNPGVYNLLNFKNGTDVVLGQAVLPEGEVSQMRMILGPNNTLVVNGVTHPLQTPSAQQSGLKFNWHQTLAANGAYTVWIDFDAGKSIVTTGNGSYILKPVIRTFSELTNGQIKGYVQPAAAEAVVHAIVASDTIATAIPNTDGFFMFSGLPQGNYTVSYDADDGTGYVDENTGSVTVTFGQITDLGTKTLHP